MPRVETRLRPATDDDLDTIEVIARGDPAGTWSREAFVQELRLEWSHTELLVRRAPTGEDVVGFMVYWVVADEIQLLYIATHPRHRRRGAARELLAHLHERARASAAARVALEVRAGNEAALALYRALGYATVGRRPGYYQARGEDAVLMEWTDGARREEAR